MTSWNQVSFEDTTESKENISNCKEISIDAYSYVIHKRATLHRSNRKEVCCNPILTTACSSDKLCISLDKDVYVFSISCSTLHCSLCTDSLIDTIALSDDSNLLVIAENSGNINIIYLPKILTLYTKRVVQPSENSSLKFCKAIIKTVVVEKNYEILIWTCFGRLIKFQNITLNGNDPDILKETNLISIQEIEISSASSLLIQDSSTFIYNNEELALSVGFGEEVMKIYSLSDDREILSIISATFGNDGFIKAKFTADKRYLIALDSNNIMNIICSQTFILLKKWEEIHVSDFVLLERDDYKSNKIGMLTLPLQGTSSFQIYSLSTLRLLFSVDVSKFTQILEDKEDVILFEGNCHDDISAIMTNITINTIVQDSPKKRLERLIKSCQFEMAIALANHFKLDTEEIYKSQMQHQLDLLFQNRIDAEGISNIMNELIVYMENSKTIKNLLPCCCRIILPEWNDTMNFFLRLKAEFLKRNAEKNLIMKLDQFLYKLKSFKILYGIEEFSKWPEFRDYTIKEMFLKLMKERKTNEAIGLWRRHEGEILLQLDENLIDEIIQFIPENIHYKVLMSWVEHNLLTSILNRVPGKLAEVMVRLISFVKNLEFTDKKSWPSNALFCAHTLKEGLNTTKHYNGRSLEYTFLSIQNQMNDKTSVFFELNYIIESLEELNELRDKHKCFISYSEYTQENKEVVLYSILNSIHSSDNVASLLNNFIARYTEKHSLDSDKVLVNYIKEIISTIGFNKFWLWAEKDLEDRIITIVRNLKSFENVSIAVFELTSCANRPWSENVQKVVNDVIALKESRSLEFSEQMQLIEIKQILYKYDLNSYDLSQHKNRMQLIQYVLMQKRECSLDDALIIAQVLQIQKIEIYFLQMCLLIQDNKMNDFLDLRKSLPQDLIVECCKRLVNYTQQMMFIDNSWIYENDKNQQQYFTKATLYLLHYILPFANGILFEEFNEYYEKFQKLNSLQLSFNIFLAGTEDCVVLKTYLISYIKETFSCENTKSESNEKFLNISNIFRLGLLLDFSEGEILGTILKTCVTMNQPERLESLIRIFQTHFIMNWPEEEIFPFIELLMEILQDISHFENRHLLVLISFIHEIVSKMLLQCSTDKVSQYLLINRWTNLIIEFVQENIWNNLVDKNFQWIVKNSFHEFYSMLGYSNITPLMIKILICFFTMYSKNRDEFSIVESTGKQIVQLLHSFKNYFMPLRIVLAIFSSCHSLMTKHQETLVAIGEKVLSRNHCKIIMKLFEPLLKSMLQQKHIDSEIVLAMSLHLPKMLISEVLRNETKRIIRQTQDYHRLMLIAMIGILYGKLTDNLSLLDEYVKLYQHASWGQTLAKYNISFKNAFSTFSSYEHSSILREIINNSDISAGLIKNYCIDFNCNIDEALSVHIQRLFSSMNILTADQKTPTFREIKDFTRHRKELSVLQRVTDAIQLIDNKRPLVQKINFLINQINPYKYDSLSFTINIIEDFILMNKKEQEIKKYNNLLKFLQVYQRHSDPTVEEMSDISEGNLIELVKTRLPFHSLINDKPWKIISKELNYESITTWLEASSLLQLSNDDLLGITVQNVLTNVLEINKNIAKNSMWKFQIPLNPVLNDIKSLIQLMENLNVATAISDWVTNMIPLSPEKVQFSSWVVQVAKNWTETKNGKNMSVVCSSAAKAEEAVKKLMKVSKALESELILVQHGLSSSNFLHLLNQPIKLFHQLFEDLNTEPYMFTPLKACKAVVRIIEDYCSVHCINAYEMKIKLLENWLTAFFCNSYNDTFMQDVYSNKENFSEREKSLQRICCLCQNSSSDKIDLLHILLKTLQDSSSNNYVLKYYVIKILIMVADSDVLEKLCEGITHQFQEKILTLYHIIQLEELHIPMNFTFESFVACDKENLVTNVWQWHKDSPQVANVIFDLCVDFNVTNPLIWNEMLNYFLKFEMISELERSVDYLYGINLESIFTSEIYIQSWKLILLKSIPSYEYEFCENMIYTHGFNTATKLFRCMFELDDHMELVSEKCFKVGLPAVGVAALLNIVDQNKQHQIMKDSIYKQDCMESIISNLYKFREIGKDLPQSAQIIKCLIDFILEEKNIEAISANYWEILIAHFITKHQFEHTLKICIDLEKNINPNSELMKLCKDSKFYSNINLPDIISK